MTRLILLLTLWVTLLRPVLAESTDDAVVQDMEPGMAEAPLLEPPSQEEIEDRTYALGKILRCPVCQGLSVADSRSDAAVAMKNRIQEFVAQGYSDDQIVDYFIGRYGEFVLLEPKSEHWFVWVMPGVIFVAGLGIVLLRVRQSGNSEAVVVQNESATEHTGQDTPKSESNAYRDQILKELGDD